MILGIQPKSNFSSLTLYNKTCPLGLLTIFSSNTNFYNSIVYNEDISGDIFQNGKVLVQDAGIIFITCNAGNISRALEISQSLKNLGKDVYLGGPEVSMIGPRLLIDHKYIDGIVIGPGEDQIQHLLSKEKLHNNPFIYTQNNKSSINPIDFVPQSNKLNFKDIKINYELLYDFDKYKGLSYFWGNDCAQARNRCFFCGRLSMGIGFRPSKRVWKELQSVYNKGIRFFYNTTDAVNTNINAFHEFCLAKPQEMKDDIHRVFINSNNINSKLIESLKLINGVAVIGIESFGNFQNSGKQNTNQSDNTSAIKTFYDEKIRMVLSFVFGLPEETKESIEYNKIKIIEIVEQYGDFIDSIHISPLLITSGSPAFKKLMSIPQIRNKYRNLKTPFD